MLRPAQVVAALDAVAVLVAYEAASNERAKKRHPEYRRVEDRVDCESWPERAEGENQWTPSFTVAKPYTRVMRPVRCQVPYSHELVPALDRVVRPTHLKIASDRHRAAVLVGCVVPVPSHAKPAKSIEFVEPVKRDSLIVTEVVLAGTPNETLISSHGRDMEF